MTGERPQPGLSQSGYDALAARIAALEAERLAPVPRASHVIGVDVDDLALAMDYLAEVVTATQCGRKPPAMSGDTAVAWQRLESAVRGHVRTAALPANRETEMIHDDSSKPRRG
jgi:hypothetical protein